MTVLSIDGGKNVGYALFTDDGIELERGVTSFDDWFTMVDSPQGHDFTLQMTSSGNLRCNGLRITQLVVEGYRHDPNVKQGGSLHWASQIEGSVKTLGLVAEIPVAVQYAASLSVAMLITGYEKPVTKTGNKKHLPDQDSAWLHGRFWFHTQGL